MGGESWWAGEMWWVVREEEEVTDLPRGIFQRLSVIVRLAGPERSYSHVLIRRPVSARHVYIKHSATQAGEQ